MPISSSRDTTLQACSRLRHIAQQCRHIHSTLQPYPYPYPYPYHTSTSSSSTRLHHNSTSATATTPNKKSQKSPPPSITSFPYILPHATRFGDVDMYGHVNNVIYYSYFDTVINTYLIDVAKMNTSDSIIGICAGSDCSYISSLNFPSPTRLALRTIHIGTTSVKYQIGIYKPSPHVLTSKSTQNISKSDSGRLIENSDENWVLCALGTFVHVFVERSGEGGQVMKPIAIPSSIKNALAAIYVNNTA